MTTRGMLLGKFMPPHMGHVYLAEFAQGYVDDLTVVVCSLEREPIPGDLRYTWMQELFPRVRVVHITDDLPQEPSEHPDFWDLWEAALRRVLPHPITHVFASEPYGEKLAQVLGGTYIPVDVARTAVPISATEIRKDPMVHWSYLPRPVRPYFLKRVSVFGPESTGKTTLASALAHQFKTVWVPEYARTWLEHHPSQAPFIPEDFRTIAKGQIASEDALARNAERLLIIDSDPLLTVAWSRALTGTCLPEVEALASKRHYDLTLLLDVDVPWVQDGVRYLPNSREAFFQECLRLLHLYGRHYQVLRGGFEAREEAATEVISSLFSMI